MERIRTEYFDMETKYRGKDPVCECCNERIVSDDPEIAEQGLCDRCNDEINEDSRVIGYRKGE